MDPTVEFQSECDSEIIAQGRCPELRKATDVWMRAATAHKYSYHFRFLGRPIIQYPQDIVAVQELIWSIKPDLIIETGVAHGGSLILSASMLALLDYCDAAESGAVINLSEVSRKVIGIDVDIRSYNRIAIEAHPMSHRIELFQGSSVDQRIVAQVKAYADAYDRIMVCLDSSHTHEHVLAELEAYASLVTPGSYCVVFDTIIEDLPVGSFPDRPWDIGDNPKTAVDEFLSNHSEFTVDESIDAKLQISVASGGFLRREL